MELYIDFDGVILDTIPLLYKKIEEANIEKENSEAVFQLLSGLNWESIIKNSKIINNSIEKINKLKEEFHVSILTHVTCLNEIEAKARFIRQYIDGVKIIAVPKKIAKYEMVDAKDAILIDDYIGNLEIWEKNGGISVLFSRKKKDYPFLTISDLEEIKILKEEKVKIIKLRKYEI